MSKKKPRVLCAWLKTGQMRLCGMHAAQLKAAEVMGLEDEWWAEHVFGTERSERSIACSGEPGAVRLRYATTRLAVVNAAMRLFESWPEEKRARLRALIVDRLSLIHPDSWLIDSKTAIDAARKVAFDNFKEELGLDD